MSEQLWAPALPGVPPQTVTEFEIFWQLYPRKVGKPYAKQVWTAARKRASYDEIMDALARYEFSPDPKFRPHPSTWLNQDRWKPEPSLTDDPYGLSEWLASLPRDGSLSAHAYDPDELRQVLIATGWERSWRGPLNVLNEWLRDGYQPESIARVIAAAVGEFGGRSALASFDRRVRYRADRLNGF